MNLDVKRLLRSVATFLHRTELDRAIDELRDRERDAWVSGRVFDAWVLAGERTECERIRNLWP
ncbi:hypothetical protein HQ346_20735 [Rhodococcus sp. BP-252]|uniref:Uncharacterized protein n=1 Tax=Rhodococcoides kyotonense TaxID=398843 RepID=A0A177Y888_9NOCA|nr:MULTISPECIES: hypothetical protein [Rhodococcus]MBY6414125.1 hypothetical protein [Rhodococcus sp. BP-320]MBY6418900.1 hypothetical protein [Rhodococcus sp. BP-321]MBY6423597.1 hypothetical protein [Rhodococcus sp. BP-324]MBY6428934.1 hypothetical protein [Rhodococcus sp. BP-323]MBY6433939.1 hypothetical protein [Rhodococcus sp. BP-322]